MDVQDSRMTERDARSDALTETRKADFDPTGDLMKHLNTLTAALFLAFVATVYGANWALDHYGIVNIGFGLMAPAGVYFAGLAFGLRDALHEHGGRAAVLVAIVVGATLSYVLGDAVTIPGGHVAIAVASGVAFLLSELADLLVYEPLRRRRWVGGVVASNLVGAIVDSALFLWLAFGSLDHLNGQVVGKAYMIALAIPIVWIVRERRQAVTA